ncbi:MAG: alpha/beta fold hydrolase [Candidatus Didemnitutus sp.]|nr:alpha/beta fold hydrolase [Candidatus Didemnitutus sp.]
MSSVELFSVDLGGAGHPPMLVLHGLLGSSRNWQTTGRDLAAHFHVIALDARNHGRSPHADAMSYELMMEDVLAWMDAHALPAATIVGHSMGGKIAMLLACRHAARVQRLVVVDVAPRDYSWQGHRAEFMAMNELNLANLQSRQEAEMRFEARVPDLGMRKFLTTNLVRTDAGEWAWAINLPVLTRELPQLEKDALTSADRYEGPTQFILGGRSRYVQESDHEAIRGHFPRVQLTTIPESGHNPHMDARAAFVRAVLEE